MWTNLEPISDYDYQVQPDEYFRRVHQREQQRENFTPTSVEEIPLRWLILYGLMIAQMFVLLFVGTKNGSKF